MTEILVYIIAGLLAGIATGLVGLSAATIIAPIFVTVLLINPYVAIGIALASDVFASSLSTFHYIRYKNIHLKRAIILAISVVLFAILGSYLSSFAKPNSLGFMLNVFVVLLGLRFIIFPIKERAEQKIFTFTKSKIISSLFWGAVIGFISGYFGAGGGLSMLVVLTIILGYDLKTGIGTSLFIMIFTAFVGAASHIIIGGTLWVPLLITAIAALVGANMASLFANKVNHKKLNRVIGYGLLILGIVLNIAYLI